MPILVDKFLKPFFPFSQDNEYAYMNSIAIPLYGLHDALKDQLIDDLSK